MTIDEVKQFFDFVTNKVQSGGYQISNFNLAAQRAQMEFFEKDIAEWEKTKQVSDALKVFLFPAALAVPPTGRLPYPSDYVHASSMGHYYADLGANVPVTWIDNGRFRERVVSQLSPPTLRFPVYTDYADYIEFAPKNIGLVQLDYFRRPVNPVWAYTIVNGRPVYNASNSVDFELPDETHNELVFMMASYMGINLRENELIQYSEIQKQQQA